MMSPTRASPVRSARRVASACLAAAIRTRCGFAGSSTSPALPSGVAMIATSIAEAGATPPSREALVAELQQHVRGKLAPYEYPKEIEFIEALPMTTTGKVQRRVLRLQEEARAKSLLQT